MWRDIKIYKNLRFQLESSFKTSSSSRKKGANSPEISSWTRFSSSRQVALPVKRARLPVAWAQKSIPTTRISPGCGMNNLPPKKHRVGEGEEEEKSRFISGIQPPFCAWACLLSSLAAKTGRKSERGCK